MDHRIPSWFELIREAKKLAIAQKECFKSVHELLSTRIEELDKKIIILNCRIPSVDLLPEVTYETIPEAREPLPNPSISPEPLDSCYSLEPELTFDIPDLACPSPIYKAKKSISTSKFLESQNTHNKSAVTINPHESELYEPISDIPKEDHATISKISPMTKSKSWSNPHRTQTKVEAPQDYEHLKQLPLPLSEYLKMNRPEFVYKANCRVEYLRGKAEMRRKLASTNIISSFNKIRLDTKKERSIPKSSKAPKDYNIIPHDYQVKQNFTEREMKRQTNRIYKSLPEVKKKYKEEFMSHLRVKNYKNRLEYGRKLQENRRKGIINYPIRAASDDVSICSTQDEYPSSEFEKAADMYQTDSLN